MHLWPLGVEGLPHPSLLPPNPLLQLGVDHKRLSQGCEDVPHWEVPFDPYTGAGIVCIFDGHHGSKVRVCF